jgi:hypothetical protein
MREIIGGILRVLFAVGNLSVLVVIAINLAKIAKN